MKTVIQIEVENGELEQILKELSEAQEKIYQCYSPVLFKIKSNGCAESKTAARCRSSKRQIVYAL